MSKSLLLIICIAVGIVALGFAFQWPAITQGWPFLLFLLCPLMHLFMGHDHGAGSREEHRHVSGSEKKNGGSHH